MFFETALRGVRLEIADILWLRSEKRRNLSMSRKTEVNIIAEGAASSPQAVST